MPALIMDFDGLMIDSERVVAEAVIEMLDDLGAQVAMDEIAHLFGSTDVDPLWDRLLRDLGLQVTISDIDAQLMHVLPARIDALPLLPGVADVIAGALAEGWLLGLATGQRRQRLDEHLSRLGLTGRFQAIVTAADVARGKPEPDIFLAVANLLGVDPAECVVVEDSLPGCQAAIAAGMQLIVCPSIVTATCPFPEGIRRVDSLASLVILDGRVESRSEKNCLDGPTIAS